MRLLPLLKRATALAVVAFAGLLLYGHARSHPEDLPWTELDLARPVGIFTGRKLTALGDDAESCRALLARAGIRFDAAPARTGDGQCGYDDGITFAAGGSLDIAYRPSSLVASCPVSAALASWEWNVVQPAALEHLGSRVSRIDHYGSYSCRRIYGRASGAWSEHASANAVDIAAFLLEDGRRISVERDWQSDGAAADFLRDARDGACALFATVLSPDYNRAHRDHLHFDQAERGAMGWRGCR